MSTSSCLTRQARITPTPTQLMLGVLSYTLKVNLKKCKVLARKTGRKTVARDFGGIRLNPIAVQCLTEMRG